MEASWGSWEDATALCTSEGASWAGGGGKAKDGGGIGGSRVSGSGGWTKYLVVEKVAVVTVLVV